MRFLPGSDIAYDLQKHRWVALGYIYEQQPSNGVPCLQRKRPHSALQEDMRAALHAEYLLLSTDHAPSLVGTYLVDCTPLEGRWPSQSVLSIRTTSLPGIFQASYRFGDIEGPMMLSTEKGRLDYFCGKDVYPDDFDQQDNEDEERPDSASPKKVKAPADPLAFHTVARSFCQDTGEVMYVPARGMINFTDARFGAFRGSTVLRDDGEEVRFSGRKICRRPGAHLAWESYGYASVRQCE